jgi:hypothetical protein
MSFLNQTPPLVAGYASRLEADSSQGFYMGPAATGTARPNWIRE